MDKKLLNNKKNLTLVKSKQNKKLEKKSEEPQLTNLSNNKYFKKWKKIGKTLKSVLCINILVMKNKNTKNN